MKQKVKFNTYSRIVTIGVLVLFVVGAFSLLDNPHDLLLFGVIMGITTIFGLYYCPVSLEADDSAITIHRLLSRRKRLMYSEIQSVGTCYPSAGGLRLCGSGGFFGYWGYFSDIMIGSYFGYYGSRNQCILVRLKNGRQYVIGCENAVRMVDYVQGKMDK